MSMSTACAGVKALVTKAVSGDLRHMSHSPRCFLFVCSESSYYTFGRIELGGERGHGVGLNGVGTWRRWVGLAYNSARGDPLFLMQNECHSSPFDQAT